MKTETSAVEGRLLSKQDEDIKLDRQAQFVRLL